MPDVVEPPIGARGSPVRDDPDATEIPTEVPTEVPTEAPTRASADVPTQAPAEEPAIEGRRDGARSGRAGRTSALLRAISDGRLGRYRVVGRLGRGGMGTVYAAVDEQLDRRVALKVLHSHVSEVREQRLRREAQALARLQHPNVVQVYSVERAHGRLFIAMELVEGQTLARWHAEPRSWQECVEAYLQAGEGLAAAHAKGLVHRDFNPNNCIVESGGHVRVLDFGLVLDASEPEESPLSASEPGRDPGEAESPSRLTAVDEVLGTWSYMPFEMLEGRTATALSDQYSFCVSLYEALFGERPYAAQTAFELILELEEGQLQPPPSGRAVPRWLRRVLTRGLSVRPEDRWPSMEALLERLRPRRRAWRWAAPAGVVAATAIAVGVASWSSDATRCTSAADRLDGIWDAATRAAVERRVLATDVEHAPETWARMQTGLDDYATAWIEGHGEACADAERDASTEEGLLDQRMRCLDGRRRALRALVVAFGDSDASSLSRAVSAIDRLPAVGRCADEAFVRGQSALPADPQQRAQLEALEDRLASARALANAGRYSKALEAVVALETAVEQLGHPPLTVALVLERGVVLRELGRYRDAVEWLERAYFEGKELGLDEEPLTASFQLSFIFGMRLREQEPARTWLGHARAEAERSGDRLRHAQVLGQEAVLEASGGNLEQVEAFEAALELLREARGPDHLAVAPMLKNLGTLHLQRAEYGEATEVLERALAIEERALGPRHPRLSGTLTNLGAVYHSRGMAQEAVQAMTRALTIDERYLEPEHPGLARSLDSLGNAEATVGRIDEARTHCVRGLEIRTKALGPEHLDVANSHMCVGLVDRLAHDGEAALRHFERGLAIRREGLGPDHPMTLASQGAIGNVHLDAGRFEAALEAHRTARERIEQTLGPEHARILEPLIGEGRALLGLGRATLAVEVLGRAVTLAEQGRASADDLDRIRFHWAVARVGAGESARSVVTMVREAKVRLTESPSEHRLLLPRIDDWLARHAK